MVVLGTYAGEMDAYLAQAVLDASGIDSELIRDDAGGMMPWLQWLHPIRLAVAEADAATALAVLAEEPGDVTPN